MGSAVKYGWVVLLVSVVCIILILSLTTNFIELSSRPPTASLIKLSWETISDPYLSGAFLFISAYYDTRNITKMNRPAVAVVAYVLESALKPKLRCHFTYADGSSICLGEAKREVVNHYLLLGKNNISVIKQPVNELLLCPVRDGDPVPTGVRFSKNHCEQNSFSEEIAVNNAKLPMKTIGVCLQGSLRQNGQNFLDRLDSFIGMCQTLGAEFITMYASPGEVQEEVVEHLLRNHGDLVNLIQWKAFESHDYHGQGGLMHDCLYRHMLMADYLVMIDLDELILPFNHLNWTGMLKELEHKGGHNYAGYSFENRFFLPTNNRNSTEMKQCRNIGKKPVYLESTNELQCSFSHGERSK